jgi:outer membrane cobalamin receptor
VLACDGGVPFGGLLSVACNDGYPDAAGEVASWVRVDVAASYELSERVAVNGRLENLLDEGYECNSGYNT